MPGISLVSALTWRQGHSGDHPLFSMKTPGGTPEAALAGKLRARVTRYGVTPTKYSMTKLEMGVLCELLADTRPDTVVEFGCGVSTELLLALQSEHGYPRRIVSFDQAAEYIEELRNRAHLADQVDSERLQIVHAPLTSLEVGGQSIRFYDLSVIASVLEPMRGAIGLFLVDGPSGGAWNRLLAGMVASHWGAPGSALVLHDALRDWELGCATVWESLGITRGTRVFPYGHGILQAEVMPPPAAWRGTFDVEALATTAFMSPKGRTVSLADAMRAATGVASHGARRRVPAPARLLAQLPVRDVFSARHQPLRLQKPRNFAQLAPEQQQRLLMRDVVDTLPGGKLWHLGGVVLTGKSQILCGDGVVAENMEGEYSWQGLVKRGRGWELEIDRELDIVERPSLIIEKHGVRNYALWWMEILPRVYFAYHVARGAPRHILLNESSQLDEKTRLLHEETLRLVAGDDVEISYANRDTLVMNAWLPNVSHFARSKTRWNAHSRQFRDFVLHACARRIDASLFTEANHRKLFVMRQDSHARTLVNPDALLEALGKRHFFAVTPGSLHWVDQIALFRGAQIVSGIHGAGLLNLLWCRPGTQVVEAFTPPTLNRNTFRHIASELDLPYRVYLEEASRVLNNANGTDTITIDIDVERFTSLLDEAIMARRRERGLLSRIRRRIGL